MCASQTLNIQDPFRYSLVQMSTCCVPGATGQGVKCLLPHVQVELEHTLTLHLRSRTIPSREAHARTTRLLAALADRAASRAPPAAGTQVPAKHHTMSSCGLRVSK